MNESRHIVNSEASTAKTRRSLRPSDLEAFGGNAHGPQAIPYQAEISGHADNAQSHRALGSRPASHAFMVGGAGRSGRTVRKFVGNVR